MYDHKVATKSSFLRKRGGWIMKRWQQWTPKLIGAMPEQKCLVLGLLFVPSGKQVAEQPGVVG